ncbi:MAG: nucleoid occlusion factor SlmA [Gammaproteobacteria bacterium]|jgi:TetR/AcrR family transcriptional regulator
MPRPSRKQAILEALARELESNPGERITTAGLARAVGVSEAALYRHFPSKARIFEGLIAFAEDGVFSRVNQILEDERHTRLRCGRILYLLLGFAEHNPGIARVLLGDAIVGERERLHERVERFFDRVTTQLRQVLREAELRRDVRLRVSAEVGAALLTAYIEGRMHQFLRSRFRASPLADWDSAWLALQAALFDAEPALSPTSATPPGSPAESA